MGKLSEEHKKKISNAKKGIIFSEEHKKALIKNAAKYWLGKKRPYPSDKTREKIREKRKGLKFSVQWKKNLSDAHKGEKNGNWNNGSSFSPYSVDWTNSLRISIRERDKYTCQLCGEKQGDRAFSVHHIDYNKQNCNPNNLTTLCLSCHGKTQTNREYWKQYFGNLNNY